MKHRKTILIICVVILIFFIIMIYKFLKSGNNISNKSADEIKNYILNIESYYAIAKVTIKSNKNENTYLVKQEDNKKNNYYMQEVLEPEKIRGVQFIFDGKDLKLENTKLTLSKIYKDYKYLDSNELSLVSFIDDYKDSEASQFKEVDGEIVLETKVTIGNKYIASKKLYFNKAENKVEKIEIKDNTQNTRIYICYQEIQLNK